MRFAASSYFAKAFNNLLRTRLALSNTAGVAISFGALGVLVDQSLLLTVEFARLHGTWVACLLFRNGIA